VGDGVGFIVGELVGVGSIETNSTLTPVMTLTSSSTSASALTSVVASS
jgi:hypothetical protein